jgi:glycosyltransferase involved in cell wall biosynthesis
LEEEYNVYFFGHQVNPFPYLHKAKLYLLTSLWEGFPLSLGEAMTCGLPIISSDCITGPREIMDVKLEDLEPVSTPHFTPYGLLMPLTHPPKNLGLWTETIINLLKDESALQQMRKGKSRMRIYDRGTITLQWLEIINEAYNTDN